MLGGVGSLLHHGRAVDEAGALPRHAARAAHAAAGRAAHPAHAARSAAVLQRARILVTHS